MPRHTVVTYCSEQSAGVVLLLALCFPVYGVMAESLPAALEPKPERQCQRWYDPHGIGPDNRLKFDYMKRCWYGR